LEPVAALRRQPYLQLDRDVPAARNICGPTRLRSAGRHTVRFDTTWLPNGTYDCGLTADDHRLVRRMVVLR